MTKKITVVAAETQEQLERDGAAVENDFETVNRAKQYAKYYLTEEYRITSEAGRRLGYAQVKVNGVCVHDYFKVK